jgi:hypothetical protein
MIRHSALWLVVAALLFSGCREASREQDSQTADRASSEISADGSDTNPFSAESFATSAKQTAADNAEPSDEMTIVMDDCKASRAGKITGGAGVISLLLGGPSNDELVRRGTVRVEEREYVLYLPKSDSYSRTNTGADDSNLENTSTLVSIDQNGDGKLTEDEGWYANLPLRLGDTMFDVAEIAANGRRIVLKRSNSALRGVIVGRTCPPFSFDTPEGREISLQTMAGKAFLLDIWSVT